MTPQRESDSRWASTGNYHPIEYELFWSNIRANAAERVEAWEVRGPG